MSATTVSGPSHYLAVRQDWLDRLVEPVLEPALPIVDPHHHLWDRPGWRYLLDELLADTNSGHNIFGTVFVQCRAFHRERGPEELRPVGETEFVSGVAAMMASGIYGSSRICAGIVGTADLRAGKNVRSVLEAHIAASGGRFRGIRHISAWVDDPEIVHPNYAPPPGMLGDAGFREGFSQLAPLGLSFDAWLYHPQIDELTALAQAFPDTQIVLDHCGGPLAIGVHAGQRDAIFLTWQASIRRLAKCPNVHVKTGGLGMRINGYDFHEQTDPPGSATLAAAWKPYIDTCIEAFGASRCMFESNFPVDKGSYSYSIYWNACKRLASGASATDKADLFSRTAARFYRLDLPA